MAGGALGCVHEHQLARIVFHGDIGGDGEIPFEIGAGLQDCLAHVRFPLSLQGGDAVLFQDVFAFAVVNGAGAEIGADFAGERGIDVALFHVVLEGEELVVLLLADGVELVIVALGAAYGQAEEHGAERIGAVDGLFEAGFGAIDAAFPIRESVAVEAGGYTLFGGGVREQVAGYLLGYEFVIGHVAVERVDHPISVAPGMRAGEVFFVSVAIGVAGKIEPGAGPFFAVVRGGQQAVYQAFVGIGPVVGEVVFDFGGGGEESGEIEVEAADLRGARGFRRGFNIVGFEARQDEGIDWIARPGALADVGSRRAADGLIGPVGVLWGGGFRLLNGPFCAAVDPGAEGGDFGFR